MKMTSHNIASKVKSIFV